LDENFFLFVDGPTFLACFFLNFPLGKDEGFGAAVFILHVGVKCSMRAVGLTTA
jgi:hypothetical protein